MSRQERIRQILQQALQPRMLIIHDDSAQHRGHGGWRPEGETHFTLEIASAELFATGRVAGQRRIYQLLANELADGLHALSIKITP